IDFLKERGLTLSEEKTHITHIDDGFDFLGFNLRKYKGKLLIKQSKSNVLSFLGNLRELIKKHATMPVNDLIRLLNPKLKGWANYY
ncbi:group II intron maturase-specific domain-containing protein, partial [Vibrio vulnificus]